MKGIDKYNVVASILFICLLPLHLLTSPIEAQSASQPSEATLYRNWYEEYQQKDFFKVIDAAITYLIQYPSGQYAKFLKRSVGPLDDENFRAENSEESDLQIDFFSLKRRRYLKPLMESSLDVNIPLKYGKTLLMVAAANGDVAAVKALLTKGAAINTVESVHGWTALIYAVWNSDISTIQTLVDNGADLEIKDAEGLTIFDHAKLTADLKVQEHFDNIRHKK